MLARAVPPKKIRSSVAGVVMLYPHWTMRSANPSPFMSPADVVCIIVDGPPAVFVKITVESAVTSGPPR